MYPQKDSEGNKTHFDESEYRLSNPVQYSAIAAGLAAVVGGTMDMLLFGEGMPHALKTGASAAVSWFFVVLGLLLFVRRQRKDRRG